MAEWIHCNKCFTRFQQNFKFFITSCGHVKCQLCVLKMGIEQKCVVCKSPCEVVQLTNNLKPEIQQFFKPATESIDNAKQVCTFQLNNTLSLLKNITSKYKAAKVEIIKSYKMIHELKKDQQRLRNMFKSSMGRDVSEAAAPMQGLPRRPMPSAGITNMSNASSSRSFMSARMMMHPRGLPVRDSPQTDTSFAASQGPSMDFFPSPDVQAACSTRRTANSARISMSNLRLDPGVKFHLRNEPAQKKSP